MSREHFAVHHKHLGDPRFDIVFLLHIGGEYGPHVLEAKHIFECLTITDNVRSVFLLLHEFAYLDFFSCKGVNLYPLYVCDLYVWRSLCSRSTGDHIHRICGRNQDELTPLQKEEALEVCKFFYPHIGCDYKFFTKVDAKIHSGSCEWKYEFEMDHILRIF